MAQAQKNSPIFEGTEGFLIQLLGSTHAIFILLGFDLA